MRVTLLVLILLLLFSSSVLAGLPDLTNYKVDDGDNSVLGQIDLHPASVRQVYCSSSIYDADNLSQVTSNATFYADTYSYASPDDNQNHYTNSSCKLVVTDAQEQNGLINCSFSVKFYALPGEWHCNISAMDPKTSESSFKIANTTINELLDINLSSVSLDFGKLVPGENTGSLDFPIQVQNLGNIPLDLAINTFGKTIGDSYSMVCTSGSLQASDLRYSTQQSVDYSLKSQAISDSSIGSTITNFDLQPTQSGTNPTSKDLYFGIGVSSTEVVSGTCNGNIMFTGVHG